MMETKDNLKDLKELDCGVRASVFINKVCIRELQK
jgi:hypothetical protein